MTKIAELVLDPTWLPEGYDARRDVVRFARIGREAIAREAFLDERMAGSVTARDEAPFDGLAAVLEKAPSHEPPAFLFHTAFCCSTLLARALDRPGHALALKEPNILLDLANARRVQPQFQREPQEFERRAGAVFALLSRPHGEGERVLIKPTNTAATLAPFAMKAGAPCLFLYGGLRDYLISLLKKGEEARSFVRQQYNVYVLDGTGLAAIPARQAMSFTDLQVAGLVWRHQIEQVHRYLSASPARVASLDFKVLLESPAATLKAAARHLGLAIPGATLDAAAAGEIFDRHSKFADRNYDAVKRDAEEAELVDRWRPELDLISRWAGALNLGVDVELPLPRALSVEGA